MGEAPKGPPVPKPKGEVAAAVSTSKDERPQHRRVLSLPWTMATAITSDVDEQGPHSDEEIQNSSTALPTGTALTGLDSTCGCSSDEDDNDGKLCHVNARANAGAPSSFPKGKISFTGEGKGSKPSSMTSHHGRSLGNLTVRGQQKQLTPPKKKPKPKGVRNAARFGVGEVHSEDEEQGEKIQKRHSTMWSRKSLHRAKIAKEYSTSESEDEVPDAEQFSKSHHSHEAMKSNSSKNKSMPNVVTDWEKLPGPGNHGVDKEGGNSSTESDNSTNTYDSDDEEEADDELESKRKTIHSGKPLLHKSPPQVKTSRHRILADEDGSIPASSGRETYRSDVESHDADHEHELWEEDQDNNTDDDRHIWKVKRRNEGNSASFSGALSRNFRRSNLKTKIFYSFRARGNDSDDEGSKAISVRNLAPAVSEPILQEFFGGCGTVTCVNISRDEFGRCSGSAYIEFDSGAAARKAIQKTGTKLLERVVFCDVAHETYSTGRHGQSKGAPHAKPAEPPPAAASAGTSGGGLDIHTLFKAFHRADNSEESVRSRHKKSKSTESLRIPKGVISPGDTITASNGNQQSVHDSNTSGESIRGGKAASAGGGSKKKLFGLSKSKSSGSGRNSDRLGGAQSHSQSSHTRAHSRDVELEPRSQSQSREIDLQSRGFEVQPRGIQSRGIVVHSRAIAADNSSIPEIAFQGYQSEGLASSKGHKRKRWSFGTWRRAHRWAKISLWKWVKKPRWHRWHFANLSARWGKACWRPSVKSPPSPLADFQVEPQSEGYPEGYPHFSSTSSDQPSPVPVAAA